MAANTRFMTGIHALVLLAIEPDRLATSDTIAEELNTNPVVVRRLFSHLRQAGLVTSQKGPNGGTRLAKPAKQITLADIYQALAQGPALRLDVPLGSRGSKLTQTLEDVFRRSQRALEKELDTTTLNDLAKRAQKKQQ